MKNRSVMPTARLLAGFLLSFVLPASLVAVTQIPDAPSTEYAPAYTAETFPGSISLDRPVIPYNEYPFPDVPYGERWNADVLPVMGVYTVVPDQSRFRLPEPAKTRLEEISAMIEAGEGVSAIAALRQTPMPNGQSAIMIGNLYLGGNGGIAQNRELGRAWIRAGAEHSPQLFQWLGNTEPDRDLKIHYYSRGLLRGCVGCAERLLRMTTAHTQGSGRRATTHQVPTIPLDLAFRYALYATEIGDSQGPSLIGLVRSNHQAAERQGFPNRASPETLAEIEAITQHEFGSTQASWERLDTGFIHGRLIHAADLVENEQWTDAARMLLATNERGRLQRDVVELLMASAPDGALAHTVNREFARRLHDAGYREYTAAVGLMTRDSLPYLWFRNGELETYHPPRRGATASDRIIQNLENRAARLLEMAANSPLTPPGVVQAVTTGDAVSRATDCLSRAVNYPNPTAFENAQRINGCRRLVEQAWAVSSEVDFGLLSDSGFSGLLQDISNGCPACRAIAVQRSNAERQAEIQRRQDRLDRWDESPAGQRTPAAGSHEEAMERAEARTDFKFDKLPEEETVAVGGLTTDEARTYGALDRFYWAYRSRARQVAAGTHRQQVEACNHWAYKTLPLCQ